MAEQDNQDYYQLIYELLASSKERAGEILSNRPELLDSQLVKLMRSLAVKLEIAGDREDANSLKYLASDLAARMREASPVRFRKKLEADRLLQQGIDQYYASKFREALQSWEQALTLYREIGNLLGEADSLGNLGNACGSLGRYEEAIDYLLHQLEIAREIGHRPEEANSLNNLGNVYYYQGRYDQAIEYHQQSLKIARKIGYRCGEANSLGNLGNAYHSLGLYDKARDYHQQKLEIAREIEDRSGEVNSLGNLGDTYNHLGRYAEAIECQQQSLKMAQEMKDRFGEANSLGNLGSVYYKLQQIPEAIQAFQSALKIFTPTGFPVECFIFGRYLGDTCFQTQQWEEAISGYEKALEAVEQRCAWEALDTGKQKLREEAVGVYQNMVQACINTGNLRKALETVERSKARNLVELLAAADFYPKGASEELKQELRRRRGAISSLSRLLANIDLNGAGMRDTRTPAYTPEAIDRLREELEEEQRELDKLFEDCNKLDPDFTLTQKVELITLEEIRELIDPHTAILEWSVGADSFHTFIITRDRLEVVPFGSAELEKLQTWTNSYLEALFNDRETWTTQLSEWLGNLSEILGWDKIIRHTALAKCDRLILVPHRYLHLFPLHALPLESNRAGELSNNCLLDSFQDGVRYAPSCQLLQQVQNRQRTQFANLFAVKNPTPDLYESDVYEDYEADLGAVEAIQKHFGQSCVLEKEGAKKAAILRLNDSGEEVTPTPELRGAHCAFFFCHGIFEPNSPLNSGLLLADEKLTLLDIFQYLDLPQCRLVTLSACETSMADFTTPTDEWTSLPSGFLFAGSTNFVGSLWQVPPEATALLMTKFYEQIDAHDANIALALNTAQIWLRDTTAQDFRDWLPKSRLRADWQQQIAEMFEEFEDTDRPLKSPENWAAFCVTGQGG